MTRKKQNSKLVPLPLSLRIWRLPIQLHTHTQTQCYTSVEQEGVKGGGENGERMSRDRLLPLVLGRESGRTCREKEVDIMLQYKIAIIVLQCLWQVDKYGSDWVCVLELQVICQFRVVLS